jgi:uncharacterized protein YigE (DUF2233 family)
VNPLLRVALLIALASCRRDARRAPASPPRARPDAPLAARPAADAPAAPRRAELTVVDRTPWAELAPGVRWAKATLRLAPSPDPVHPDAAPRTLLWVVTRLEVARVEVSVERSPDDAIEALAERARSAVLVTDSGFFEPDNDPSGVVISRGRTLHGAGPRGGSGVLAFAGDRVAVVPVDTRDGGTFAHDGAVTTALQCGPRVVDPGARPGIYRHDGRFAARTVACVREEGRVLDVVTTWDVDDGLRGPELYDLATVLAGPSPLGDASGCEAALNLDGGPSTGLYLRDQSSGGRTVFRHAPLGPTPWGLVVRPRG